MNVKRIITGEPMPSKDDPANRERYDKFVKTGSSFAKYVKLDKLVAKIQHFACKSPALFMWIIFTFVIIIVGINIYRIASAVSRRNNPASAVKTQERVLKMRRHGVKNAYKLDLTYNRLNI